MKRLRPSSYSSDEDEDWDRPPRRFHHHPSVDRDLRPPRKRLDRDSPDPFPERRRSSVSSSASFSAARRDFPKGFRSERDRSRRTDPASAAGAWRRSSSTLREISDERARERSRDPPTPRSAEPRKPEPRGGGAASDVEEGEFAPDPVPPQRRERPELKTPPEERPGPGSEVRKDRKLVLVPAAEEEEEGAGRRKIPDASKVEKLMERCREELPVAENLMATEEAAVALAKEVVGENLGTDESLQARSVSPVVGSEEIGEGKVSEHVEDRGGSLGLGVSAAEVASEVDKTVAAVNASDERKADVGIEVAREGHVAREGLEHLAVEAGEESRALVPAVKVESEAATVGSVGESLEATKDTVTLGLLTSDSGRDKGKAPVTSPSNEGNSLEENDAMEGPSSRGFELVFQSDVLKSDRVSAGGIVIGKSADERPKLEPLDLSLGLPGISTNASLQKRSQKPSSPQRTRSFQSFASSFRTNSDDFTTSISLSGSQTFVHNPSCSLQQNSMENFEHSVHSRPIFQGIDPTANGTVWQGHPSNEIKQKGEVVPLYQRILMNGSMSHHSTRSADAENSYLKSNGLIPQSDHSRHLHPAQSHASQEMRTDCSKENKVLKRGASSSSLFRSEAREKDHVILNGSGFEKFLPKIVSEPVLWVGRQIQEMKEPALLCMKQAAIDILVNRDRHGELLKLQEVLSRRSDLSFEILSKCHRVHLEFLVAIKTGLRDFLGSTTGIPSSDLAEIFLNTKCRNLACRGSIPFDDCDCKVCSQKNGFCSQCMCLICSKFDEASNTCSWVGCDVCQHWCHTDCGLRDSYIRNGASASGAPGTTEMQFHCIACGHTSEMFGFVKDVFSHCARDWNAETLAKEFEYVRRIFSGSADRQGKRLQEVAIKLIQKLENKTNLPEVVSSIMDFLAEGDSKLNSNPPVPSKEIPRNTEGNDMKSAGNNPTANSSNCLIASAREPIWHSSAPMEKSSEKPAWHPSFSTEKSPHVEVSVGTIPNLEGDRLKSPRLDIAACMLPSYDYDKLGRRNSETEFRPSERKAVPDELDNIVKFKQEEAKLYQSRADEARREAEGLKRIATAKNEKIDEEYSNRLAKLRLYETEERQRQKIEELQALERAQHEYFNMKVRMEAEIKNLLLKMEAVKHNLRT